MSKSSSSTDDSDAKKNTKTKNNVLFSSPLFNLGGREEDERNFDATSSSTTTTPFHHHHAGGELARIIRARSTRFLTHASPTVAAVEENVASAIALARGDALTKTLEVHALMDADGRHVGRSLARVNEDATFFGVESEALAKTKRDIEALVEAKEKEREKEERKREKETKERRRKELKEAMMFRKEEE